MPRDRDERREYENDVLYEVWRSGGNPDRIDYDRMDDYRYDGVSAESAAHREMERMRPRVCESCGGQGFVEIAQNEYQPCPACG